ncbi:hypothetical protein KUCAC02_009168, partial [Chaenocephalus aceratus]
TVTCPLQSAPFHTALTPTPLNPALYSLNMPHEMPHDSLTYRCSQIFRPF